MKKNNKNASQTQALLPVVLIAASVGILVLGAFFQSSVWPLVFGSAALLLCALAIHEMGKKRQLVLQAEIEALSFTVNELSKTDTEKVELIQLADTWVPTLNSQLSTNFKRFANWHNLHQRCTCLNNSTFGVYLYVGDNPVNRAFQFPVLVVISRSTKALIKLFNHSLGFSELSLGFTHELVVDQGNSLPDFAQLPLSAGNGRKIIGYRRTGQ